MAGRILFELFFFSIPFVIFGLYLAATAEAEQEGRRKWPINVLFLIGLSFAVIAYFVMAFMEDRTPTMCQKPTRYVDGKLVPGEKYPCEHDLKDAGRALSDDPGGAAELGHETEPGTGEDAPH
ncbi:MAG TPA: DUF6111 family protein [Hyphomonas sp.]|nr:hypothetical protein [Hyphomonas sp.]MCB9963256.1 hypothetical protein [Hyphomonas sp.]MCC0017732.1 hypothetical protein [Rhodobiaceae bacterium]HPE48300.1 DUF6111 family protein [Hyphomonas sp.]